jgi:hypothetical protein
MQPGLVSQQITIIKQVRNKHGILFNGNIGLPGGAGGNDWRCICGNIVFHVEKSCPNFALSVKGSKKEITQVDVREHGSDNLEPMKKSGESWTISKTLKGPLNIHLVAEGGGWRVLDDVIPEGWKARTDYPTKLQFGA